MSSNMVILDHDSFMLSRKLFTVANDQSEMTTWKTDSWLGYKHYFVFFNIYFSVWPLLSLQSILRRR